MYSDKTVGGSNTESIRRSANSADEVWTCSRDTFEWVAAAVVAPKLKYYGLWDVAHIINIETLCLWKYYL